MAAEYKVKLIDEEDIEETAQLLTHVFPSREPLTCGTDLVAFHKFSLEAIAHCAKTVFFFFHFSFSFFHFHF